MLPSQTFSGMFPQFFKRIHSQSFRFLCHHVSRKSGLNRNLILNSPMSVPILDLTPLGPSPPQRFPLVVPIKIANINEKLNARGGGGGGLSFFFFFHSSLPATQRGRSAEWRPSMVHAGFNINLQVFPLPIRPVLN